MRVSEWIVAAFFAWTTALALVVPLSGHMRARVLLANCLILLVYTFLARVRNHPWTDTARDWIPQALMILAYKEMTALSIPPKSHAHKYSRETTYRARTAAWGGVSCA